MICWVNGLKSLLFRSSGVEGSLSGEDPDEREESVEEEVEQSEFVLSRDIRFVQLS